MEMKTAAGPTVAVGVPQLDSADFFSEPGSSLFRSAGGFPHTVGNSEQGGAVGFDFFVDVGRKLTERLALVMVAQRRYQIESICRTGKVIVDVSRK